jgi:hypothetical protein
MIAKSMQTIQTLMMEIGAEENEETLGICFYTYLTSWPTCQFGFRVFGYGYEILLSVSFLSADLRLNPYPHPRVETETRIRAHWVFYPRARR